MAREAKLRCPNCGTQVTVYEDEVGESGHCPGCGSDLEVFKQDFGAGKQPPSRAGASKSLAARVANLVGRAAEREPANPDQAADDNASADGDDSPDEEQDADILAELLQDDAEGMAAAEEALQEAEAAPTEAGAGLFPQETEYRLWQGLAEEAGDRAMAARLALWLRAEQAGCSMTLDLPDGVRVPIPQIVLAEAAAAQAGRQDEPAWRDGWTRRLLKMAAEWPDEDTIEGVVTVLNHTDDVVDGLKSAGVWPWAADGDAS